MITNPDNYVFEQYPDSQWPPRKDVFKKSSFKRAPVEQPPDESTWQRGPTPPFDPPPDILCSPEENIWQPGMPLPSLPPTPPDDPYTHNGEWTLAPTPYFFSSKIDLEPSPPEDKVPDFTRSHTSSTTGGLTQNLMRGLSPTEKPPSAERLASRLKRRRAKTRHLQYMQAYSFRKRTLANEAQGELVLRDTAPSWNIGGDSADDGADPDANPGKKSIGWLVEKRMNALKISIQRARELVASQAQT